MSPSTAIPAPAVINTLGPPTLHAVMSALQTQVPKRDLYFHNSCSSRLKVQQLMIYGMNASTSSAKATHVRSVYQFLAPLAQRLSFPQPPFRRRRRSPFIGPDVSMD